MPRIPFDPDSAAILVPANLPWTHFYIHPDGRILAFTPDKCEHCGAPIREPNSVYMAETPERLVSLGMTQASELPDEGYYSDAIDGEACYTCNA